MKRLIDTHLRIWKDLPSRYPLIVHGARQVGKTHAVRQLGKFFDHFVEINLEEIRDAHRIFEKDLTASSLIIDLEALSKKHIKAGKTLLFLDEIQSVPRALTSLRYFYEQMPDLHVIAAGSLLDFVIDEVGFPVGRVQSLYLYPLTFLEFLAAANEHILLKNILMQSAFQPMSTLIHEKILEQFGRYIALGGMPQVVKCWRDTQDPLECSKIQSIIVRGYRQDFGTFARKSQFKHLNSVFEAIPLQFGSKFKYSEIEGDFRKRELAPALDLLETAGLAHRVYASSAQGIPLGAQSNPKDYKVLFLDIGLAQNVLNNDFAGWFINPLESLVNKGQLVETCIGQELIAYNNPYQKKTLYYWHRELRTSKAEIDYVISHGSDIVPIEVKSGLGTTLKSLHSFLESHQKASYGVRFSTQNFSQHESIHSYPLYAVSQLVAQQNEFLKRSLMYLFEE